MAGDDLFPIVHLEDSPHSALVSERVKVFRIDPHQLSQERSIAYHQVIAERLQEQPEILEKARRRVREWLAASDPAPFYARRWAEILAGDPASIAAFLVARTELAYELRQSPPLPGPCGHRSAGESSTRPGSASPPCHEGRRSG